MIARWTSPLTGSVVYEADARKVAEALPEGVASCAILDGAYNLKKADWDHVPRGGSLGDWYSGHLDDVGRVCSKSASLYVWNTSGGWAELHPLILARGWTFRTLIVWDKHKSPLSISYRTGSSWIDVTEVCGFYQRGEPTFNCAPDSFNLWGEYVEERLTTDEWRQRKAVGPRERVPLHPCQKPLLFAERMIRASTRPGDTVWVPFGGTLRELVAAERIARGKIGEARRVITCELNQDGVDYIGPAIAQAQGLETKTGAQVGLFGGAL